MSREIKFRAWDKQEKKMHEALSIHLRAEKVIVSHKPFGNVPLWDYDLMQFTGLKDNHLKEVYEGDVVKITGADFYSNDSFSIEPEGNDEWEYIGIVKSDSLMWLLENPKDRTWFPMCDAINDYLGVEVIGNIYENPELLKEAPNAR